MDVIIEKNDSLFAKIKCEQQIANEIYDYFSFFVDGYKFMPKYKKGLWNGKVYLFNFKTRLLYSGLVPDLEIFCNNNGYQYQIIDNSSESIDKKTIKEFFESIDLITKIKPYDYQILAAIGAIVEKTSIIQSPTGSGKSLIMFLLCNFFLNMMDKRVLIIVPNINLVEQLYSDFNDYDKTGNFHENVNKIYDGKNKYANKKVTISTWQSIYKEEKEYFDNFDVLIIDEVHLAESKSLKTLVEKCTNSFFRIGLTATIKDTKTHIMYMKGVFGKIIKTTSTKELIKSGKLSDIFIEVYNLKYPIEERKIVYRLKEYKDEIDFLLYNDARNKFIVQIALKQPKNTLVLFSYIDKHGKILYEIAKKEAAKYGKQIYFVVGDVSIEEREKIRKMIEEHDDMIVFANFSIFGTGVNMKNLHTIIFAHPYKSKVKTLQSIGRGLRKSNDKTQMKLIDICDDLEYRKRKNITLKHTIDRLSIYDNEEFNYVIKSVQL